MDQHVIATGADDRGHRRSPDCGCGPRSFVEVGAGDSPRIPTTTWVHAGHPAPSMHRLRWAEERPARITKHETGAHPE